MKKETTGFNKNYFSSLNFVICGIFILSFSSTLLAQSPVFRAGASTANITPFLGLGIVGNFVEPPATYIHDELFARSLVLDDGNSKLVFVIVDNVGVGNEVFVAAKRLILEETKIPPDHIIMSSTHTHSATSAGGLGIKRRGWNEGDSLDEYQRFLARRIADGVRVALNNLEPARIGWGAGSTPQHLFNRRWKLKNPVVNPFGVMEPVMMNPGVGNPNLLEPAGTTDPDVSFISIQSLEGRPIALLANYSLHYVGGVPAGDISADYYGVFANRIRELLNGDRDNIPFVGMMSNGTSGDVNNINVRGPVEKYPSYAKMRIVADDVAREVLRVYQAVKYQDWVPLKAAKSELNLHVRKPGSQMLADAQAVLQKPATEKLPHPLTRIYAERIIQLKEWPDSINIILQTFRIGDLGIAAIPFEVFAETGLEIKAKSPFKPSFTIELANGYYGYLPTPEQHKLGGYETWFSTNRVETEASRKIVAELMKLFNRLQ